MATVTPTEQPLDAVTLEVYQLVANVVEHVKEKAPDVYIVYLQLCEGRKSRVPIRKKQKKVRSRWFGCCPGRTWLPCHFICCGIGRPFNKVAMVMAGWFVLMALARWPLGICTLVYTEESRCSSIGIYTIIKALEATAFWTVVLVIHQKAQDKSQRPNLLYYDIFLVVDLLLCAVLWIIGLFVVFVKFMDECVDGQGHATGGNQLTTWGYVFLFLLDTGAFHIAMQILVWVAYCVCKAYDEHKS